MTTELSELREAFSRIKRNFKSLFRRVQQLEIDNSTQALTAAFSNANVSDPPSDAELDAAFGTPATVGAGFLAVIDDNGGDTDVRIVASNGTSWWYSAKLTKAT